MRSAACAGIRPKTCLDARERGFDVEHRLQQRAVGEHHRERGSRREAVDEPHHEVEEHGLGLALEVDHEHPRPVGVRLCDERLSPIFGDRGKDRIAGERDVAGKVDPRVRWWSRPRANRHTLKCGAWSAPADRRAAIPPSVSKTHGPSLAVDTAPNPRPCARVSTSASGTGRPSPSSTRTRRRSRSMACRAAVICPSRSSGASAKMEERPHRLRGSRPGVAVAVIRAVSNGVVARPRRTMIEQVAQRPLGLGQVQVELATPAAACASCPESTAASDRTGTADRPGRTSA